MLFATEISKLYNIETGDGKPHPQLIKSVIEDYMIDKNIVREPLYYSTRNGMAMVYPHIIYHLAMQRFLNNTNKTSATQIYKSPTTGKEYKFTIF